MNSANHYATPPTECVEMASCKYKYIKIKPRICALFIFCQTWTVNANSLKQNIIVIKEMCSSQLPPWLDE